MGLEVQSFEVYGFRIEVHAGGRRVWPPSFKRFINKKLTNGDLTVTEVMKQCNVSQSLVYKWRGDVRRAKKRTTHQVKERVFSEIVVEGDDPVQAATAKEEMIQIRRGDLEVTLPISYSVNDLADLLQALGGDP